MSRYAYVNGRYLPMRDAKVHIEDRGYQFSDGVYEVCEVRGGRLIDERRHLARLARSLGELRIRAPMSPKALGVVLREVVAKNRIGYGIVYLQITRGVARRDHAFPAPEVPPSVVVTARALNKARNEIYLEQAAFLQKVRAEQAELAQAARAESDARVKEIKLSIAKEAEVARQHLESQADALAGQIADAILTRRVA